MIKNRPTALDLIDQSFLSEEMKSAYKEVLDKRYKQVGLIN